MYQYICLLLDIRGFLYEAIAKFNFVLNCTYKTILINIL